MFIPLHDPERFDFTEVRQNQTGSVLVGGGAIDVSNYRRIAVAVRAWEYDSTGGTITVNVREAWQDSTDPSELFVDKGVVVASAAVTLAASPFVNLKSSPQGDICVPNMAVYVDASHTGADGLELSAKIQVGLLLAE